MTGSELKLFFRRWVQALTWQSRHPSDDERFNQALKSAFDSSLEKQIDADNFVEAILDLAEEFHPTMSLSRDDDFINDYAKRLEHIQSYLNDNHLRGN
jgi:hypothetical protein